MLLFNLLLVVAATSELLGVLAVSSQTNASTANNCWTYLTSIPSVSRFVDSISKAAPRIQKKLALGEFKFTIFAYNDNAYKGAVANGFEEVVNQSDTIKYHIYGGGLDLSNRIKATDFYWRDIDQTLLSVPVFASQMTETDPTDQSEKVSYYVNGARVVESFTNSTSCYVYALNHVLLPLAKSQTIFGFLQSSENNLSRMNNLLDAVAAEDPTILNTLRQLRLGSAFLPTDEAFDKLEDGAFDRIKSNPIEARKTLLAHFSFSATYFTGKIKPGTLYPMEYSVIQGTNILKAETDIISYNGMRINLVEKDVTLSNGVVHLVDTVLTPPTDNVVKLLSKLDNLSRFLSLVSSTSNVRDLLSTPTRFTVFAPIDVAVGDVARFDDDAIEGLIKGFIVKGQFATSNLKQLVSVDEMALPFTSFLTTVAGTRLDIIKFHNDLFISDGSSMARIIRGYSDIAASNGFIHYVDSFIGDPNRNVFDTVETFGANLNTTAASLRHLGFNDVLSPSKTRSALSSGKWWIMFIPIESSWKALRFKKGASVLLQNRLAMSRVWRRHIFHADSKEASFIRQDNLTDLNALLTTQSQQPASIEEKSHRQYIFKMGDISYEILFNNIGCSNGVIHIIDRLMLKNDDPIAELNVGNPRISDIKISVDGRASLPPTHIATSYDDYGSTMDTFSPAGVIDLDDGTIASVVFSVNTGDFYNQSLASKNVPLPTFSFSVPEWDIPFSAVFFRNMTSVEATKQTYDYSFSSKALAQNGICKSSINPVASTLPGHHQGRAFVQFTFVYSPVLLSIQANVSARGCLFICNIGVCPLDTPLRVLWGFSTDAEALSADDSNDEAFSLGNVAYDNRQFYLDTVSCGRMVSSAKRSATIRRTLKVSCRVSTDGSQATKTITRNFYETITENKSP